MTYPPTGGYDPQQYHVSSQPPQPNDPYAQGYNAQPPPPNYDPSQGQYPPPAPDYSQPQGQYPPNMTPPLGVQPGYPQGGSPLPPPIPPASQGSNLGIILGIIVGLVVILGVAAVLIVPGMLEDDDEPSEAGGETTSEPAEEEPSEEPSEEAEESEAPEGEETGGTGGFEGWGTPVSSENYDLNTPEGAAIAWEIAVDDGDMDALADLMCSSPSDSLEWAYDYELEYNSAPNYDFLIWSLAKEPQGGEVEVWAGWTWDDTAPDEQDDMDSGGGQYFTAVEEDGTWKLCDLWY